jgi:hypothetical protein
MCLIYLRSLGFLSSSSSSISTHSTHHFRCPHFLSLVLFVNGRRQITSVVASRSLGVVTKIKHEAFGVAFLQGVHMQAMLIVDQPTTERSPLPTVKQQV